MSYILIHDVEQVKLFERLFYSPGEKNNRIFLTYISDRKNYYNKLSYKCSLKRTVVRYNYDETQQKLIDVVRNYEIPLGTYRDQQSGINVPQEAIEVYTSINPRDPIQATQSLTNDILEKAFSNEKEFFSHIDQKFKNKLQKYATKKYIGIEIDTKDEAIFQKVMKDVCEHVNVYVVIEHRYGYHIIIPKRELQRTTNGLRTRHFLYTQLAKKYDSIYKISSDLFSPIPGTYQGGFPVKFMKN